MANNILAIAQKYLQSGLHVSSVRQGNIMPVKIVNMGQAVTNIKENDGLAIHLTGNMCVIKFDNDTHIAAWQPILDKYPLPIVKCPNGAIQMFLRTETERFERAEYDCVVITAPTTGYEFFHHDFSKIPVVPDFELKFLFHQNEPNTDIYNEPSAPLVSFFLSPITNIKPVKNLTLEQIYLKIVGGDYINITKETNGATKEQLDKLKKNDLDYVTFSCICNSRSAKEVIQHSGYICVDVDHVGENTELSTKIREVIIPALLFTSPSGTGLKVVFQIDILNGAHIEYFIALQEFFKQTFNIQIDTACKDVVRACFLCHDPDVYFDFNPEFLGREFITQFTPEKLPESPKTPLQLPITPQNSDDRTPGQVYNADPASKYNTFEILKRAGWKSDTDNVKWTRPGKESGISATWEQSHENKLHVFTSNAPPFEADHEYDPFQILSLLEFSGDFSASAKMLAEKYQMSKKKQVDTQKMSTIITMDAISGIIPEALANEPVFEDEPEYIRVGCNYYKKIVINDASNIHRSELRGWMKAEITQDHGKDFLKGIDKYDEFTVEPDNTETYQQIIDNTYNRYYQLVHTPIQGEWPTTKALLDQIFGDQYLLGIRYMQKLYLYPKRQAPILAIVSIERETGKTTFANWLEMIFGGNAININSSDLGSDFNSYATKSIIIIDEAMVDKNLSSEKLKSMATAKFLTVNEKFLQPYKIPFYGHFILTSNNEERFSKISDEEVRYFVRKVKPLDKDRIPDFEKKLQDEIPAFLYYLTTLPPIDLNVSRCDFTAAELDNEALKKAKLGNKDSLYVDLKEQIIEWFHDNPGKDEFYASLTDIKKGLYLQNSQFTISWIRQIIRQDFHMEDELTTRRYTNFITNTSKTGTPYCFRRENFIVPQSAEIGTEPIEDVRTTDTPEWLEAKSDEVLLF